jgi:hypothetical protein
VPLEHTCEYDFTSVIFFTGLALDLALGQSSLNHKKPENWGHKKVAENKMFVWVAIQNNSLRTSFGHF